MPVGGQELGLTGLNVSVGGIITEEFNPNLTGRKAIETWRDMSHNDPLVGAILFAIDMLVRQVEWSVEQLEASEEDSKFLEECMEDMSQSWGDLISEILSMLPYGFSFHEIVYKKRSGQQPEGGRIPSSRFSDGKIGWRKIPIRGQETLDHWDFDPNGGGLQAFVQKSPPDYQDRPIPIQKGLLFRTTTYKNNPEGRSVLRTAYRAWYFKKRIEEIEGVGIERDLAGFPVFWIPAEMLLPTASDAEKSVVNSFDTVGKNIRRDKQEYLMMPLAYDDNNNKMFDFTLTNSGGTRTFDTSAIIGRYDQRIAMTVLADFILLGHEKVGSFALSSDKTDLFAVALGTFLDIIQDVFNRFAVPRLFELNGMNMENLPEIKHGDIESPNLAELSAFIKTLVDSGVPMFPDEDLETHLREVANLPEKSEEAKQLQEQKMQEEAEDRERQIKLEEAGVANGAGRPGGAAAGLGAVRGNPRTTAATGRTGRGNPQSRTKPTNGQRTR